jgi:hypothetical protein
MPKVTDFTSNHAIPLTPLKNNLSKADTDALALAIENQLRKYHTLIMNESLNLSRTVRQAYKESFSNLLMAATKLNIKCPEAEAQVNEYEGFIASKKTKDSFVLSSNRFQKGK